ncbi:MAG: hypothetical protein ABI640_12130 [Gammaproteobacteria bacterium]
MDTRVRGAWFGCAITVIAGMAAVATERGSAAQWVDYPTANVPRNADGSPNLKAPAPRAADGKPDLSGMWFSAELLPECADTKVDCIPQMNLPADQINIGRTLKDGLPYTPWAAKLVAERTANGAKDDPHAFCLPPNFPRAYSLPQYIKIAQMPKLTIVLHEFNASYRQIFTDGRPLPKDPLPAWNGYSVGHWERDTLVVESSGFRDDLWLDLSGSPMTSAAHVVERIKRPSFGSLEIEVTVNDPKAYTKPWTVTLRQNIVLDTELIEETCLENERDTGLFKKEGAK